MLTICFRTIVIYFTLIISLRLMGKRQLGELQASEFIITLMLSEIAVSPIISESTPLSHALISVFLLLAIEIAVSHLLLRCNVLKRFFYGSPSIIMRKGKIDQDEMKKQRLEIDELLSELRQKGYSSLEDINYVILEENGKISVFPKAQKTPLTPDDVNISPTEYGISHLIVLDGSVIKKDLDLIGWDQYKLNKEIKKRSLEIEEIFIMTVDDSGRITVIPKNKK